jgi:hypothetical protein
MKMISYVFFESDAAVLNWVIFLLLSGFVGTIARWIFELSWRASTISAFIMMLALVFTTGTYDQPPDKTTQLTVKQIEAFEALYPGEDIPWKERYSCDKHWSVGIVLGDRSAIFLTEGRNIAWGPEAHVKAEKCLSRYRRFF